jgi:surface antigen
MLKQKYKIFLSTILKSRYIAVGLVMLVVGGVAVPQVFADRFDDQINQLNQDSSQKRQVRTQLGVEAASLSDTIAKLQGQIDVLTKSINDNQAKQQALQTQIDAAEKELAKQKKVLGENIKTMYLEGQISTLEMLASSKNLSEFIDKQQYRNSVQSKIKTTMDKITALKFELSAKKDEVDKLLKDQRAMQSQLDGQRAENDRLLSLNEGQQADLNAQIKQNSAQVAQLRAQQAAENARLFSGANVVLGSACDTSNGDTYPSPWCSSAQDSMIDSWGMFNRECVSYTAWKVAESGRYMPYWGGVGNANQWDDNAIAAGIPVDGNPRPGDVAIKNSWPYGHAMYVESVNANGTINISQYNAQLTGQFSRAYNVSPYGLVFIHF